MSDVPEIHGLCPPAFAPVRAAFAANFADHGEIGARFVATLEGEAVVDLWAGTADRAREFMRTYKPSKSVSKRVADPSKASLASAA